MIVLDTSVISAFCEIERFYLLREILSRLGLQAIVPSTVEKEIVFDEAFDSLTAGSPTSKRWLTVVKTKGYEGYLKRLHTGEAGVIALAKEKNGIAVLDDLDAREVARGEGVKISGTLGIIKGGYELCPVKTKNELKAILEDLKEVHFRMDREIEKEILNTKKEK